MSRRIVWFKNNVAVGVYNTTGEASEASGFTVNAINSSLMGGVKLPRAQRFEYEVTKEDLKKRKESK